MDFAFVVVTMTIFIKYDMADSLITKIMMFLTVYT